MHERMITTEKTNERDFLERAKEIIVEIKVPAVDRMELLSAALECQLDRYDRTDGTSGIGKCEYDFDVGSDGMIKEPVYFADCMKDKWMLDYLLKVYTNYNQVKGTFRRQKNSKKATLLIKQAYVKAAAKANPYLADICSCMLDMLVLGA